MKQTKNLLIRICLLFVFGCEEEKPIHKCIDKTKIRNGACTADYSPVCGCDGKTYSNACVADLSGVTSWTAGVCN